MRRRKRLLGNPLVLAAASWLLAAYVRLVFRTTRWTWRGRERLDALARGEGGMIGAFWHNRLMMMPFIWPRSVPIHMMISSHGDGRLISKVIQRLGIETVEGSSSRGAVQALKGVIDRMKAGGCVAITPDGPRGPRMRAAAGVVAAARLAGAPILPVSLSVRHRKVLGSWDRFIVALPFGRGAFVVGDPIRVPREASAAELEAYRQQVEDRLTVLSDLADGLVGVAPISPAAVDTPVKGGGSRPGMEAGT